MLTKYIEAAMRLAEYEKLEDGTYFGTIPGFQGVWANDPSLAACQIELQSVLEDWLLIGLWFGDEDLPVLGRLSLLPPKKTKRAIESRLKTRLSKAS